MDIYHTPSQESPTGLLPTHALHSTEVAIFQKVVDDVQVAMEDGNAQRWDVQGVSSTCKRQQLDQLVLPILLQRFCDLMMDTCTEH